MAFDEYISGGYVLLRAANPGWPQWKEDGLLPPKVISLSECISPKVVMHWGWETGDKQAALDFGIPETKWEEFKEWIREGDGSKIDIFSIFRTVDFAREFASRFIPHTTNLYLLGLGIHKKHLSDWNENVEYDANGLQRQIARRQPLTSGGEQLGYELVTIYALDDSWLCNGIERDMHSLYGIRPNQYGLISTYDEAKKVYEWIAEDEQQGTRAEPLPYEIFMLVSYSLSLAPSV